MVAAHAKVHVAAGHRIRVALLYERDDHLLHGLDLARGAWADVGVQDAKAVHLLDELVREFLRDLGCGATLLVGAVDDLVIHVGEVLGKRDLVALKHEVTTNHVKAQERATVSNVDLVVHGRSAHIHANLAWLDGLELLLAMVLAVVDEHADSYPSVSQ